MIDCDLNDKVYTIRMHKKIHQAKKKIKPNLSKLTNGWQKYNYATSFDFKSLSLKDNITRIDKNIVSVDEFRENYEKNNIPVIIVNNQKNWLAHHKWTLHRLKLKYRNQLFRCGEDSDGCSVKIKMKYYADYMKCNTDDSPLYIFDDNIEDNPKKAQLLEDYITSDYFYEDLFSIIGNAKRPPYRWFVMGPTRSGTGIHIDPLGTSAWNALVKGYKRWCFFPPCTPKFLLKPALNATWKRLCDGITWFDIMYNRMLQPDWPLDYKMIEALQGPGETIFVPSGWWHVVLNLTDTVAITQNYCSSINFPNVWYNTAKSRKKFSKLWYKKLSEIRPDLCKIADNINLKEPLGKYYMSETDSSSSSSTSLSSSLSLSNKTSISCEDSKEFLNAGEYK